MPKNIDGSNGSNDGIFPIVLVNTFAARLNSSANNFLVYNNVSTNPIFKIDGSSLSATFYCDVNIIGNASFTSVSNIDVTESMMSLANGNTAADLVDIGFYGIYGNSGTKYRGLVKSVSLGRWILFKDIAVEPSSTVTLSGSYRDTLEVQDLYYGGAGETISSLKTDVDGFPDALKNLTTAEIGQLENIGSNTISATQWGYLSATDQSIASSASPSFAGLTLTSSASQSSGVFGLTTGSASAPSLYMGVDTTSGIYRYGSNQIGISASAGNVAIFTTAGLTLKAGNAGAPSLMFSDSTTGFYKSGTDQISLAVSAAEMAQFASTGCTLRTSGNNQLTLLDTTSWGADVGGQITLSGYTDSNPTTTQLARVKAGKTDSTTGGVANLGGYLAFYTNSQAGTLTESFRIDTTQNLVLNSKNISGVTTLNATTVGGTLSTAVQPNVTSVGTLSSLYISSSSGLATSITGFQTSLTSSRITGMQIDAVSYYSGAVNNADGIFLNYGFYTSLANSISTGAAIRIYNNVTGLNGSISTLYGLFIQSGTSLGTGSCTMSYGAYITQQAVGTTKCATYTDNLSVGYTGVAPPAYGAIISGTLSVGTSDSSTYGSNKLYVVGTTYLDGNVALNSKNISGVATLTATTVGGTLSTAAQPNVTSVGTLSGLSINSTSGLATSITGFQTSLTSSRITGMQIDAVSYYSGAVNNADGIFLNYGFYAPVSNSIATGAAIRIYNNVTGLNGSISTLYGLFIQSGTSLGTGSCTMSYGAYITQQAVGTTKCATYTDNLSVGYTGVAPPASGAIISGTLSVGTSSSVTYGSNKLFVVGTTYLDGNVALNNNNLSGVATLTATTVGGTLSTAVQPNVTTLAGVSTLGATGVALAIPSTTVSIGGQSIASSSWQYVNAMNQSVASSASPTFVRATLGNGLVGTPSINYGDSGTGFYRPALNAVALSNNGAMSLYINASGNMTIGSSDLASTTSKLYANGTIIASRFAGTGLIQGANDMLIIGGTTNTVVFVEPSNSSADSQIVFGFNKSKGTTEKAIFKIFDNVSDKNELFVVNTAGTSTGTNNVKIGCNFIQTLGVTSLPAGLVGTPSLHFGNSTTGFYRAGLNQIGVAVNGANVGTWSATGLAMNSLAVSGVSTLTATTLGGTLSTASQNSVTTMTGVSILGATATALSIPSTSITISGVAVSATQFGYLGALNQGLTTTSNVTYGTINGSTITGTSVVGSSAVSTAQLIATQTTTSGFARLSLVCGTTTWTNAAGGETSGLPGCFTFFNGSDRLIINSTGGVTIGSSDLASTSSKLYVSGFIVTSSGIKTGSLLGRSNNEFVADSNGSFGNAVYGDNTSGTSPTGQLMIAGSTDTNKRFTLAMDTTNNRGTLQAVNAGTATLPIYLNPGGGDVYTRSIFPIAGSTYDLGTSGTRWNTLYAVAVNTTSDATLKNTIKPSNLGLEFINKIDAISYIYNFGKRTHYGFTVQNVQKILSELKIDDFAGITDPTVLDPDSKDPKGMVYSEFICPIVKSIQELTTIVNNLMEKNKELTERISVLEGQ